MTSFDDISKLYETLLKVESLYAGAATPGEKNAAGAAAERIRQKIDEYIDSDPPREIKCSFSNIWSKRLFCALAKRYGLQPYRYYRQRYTTVMVRVSGKFLDDVLWKEFEELDDVLEKYIDDITKKVIAESVFNGSSDEEVLKQPLLESDTPSTPQPVIVSKPITPPLAPQTKPESQVNIPKQNTAALLFKKVPRNSPCPCGSGMKFKKCCGNR
jgi:hypothetical protein